MAKRNWVGLFFCALLGFAHGAYAQNATWFDIFNVSNSILPGESYGYSILSTESGCASPCVQMPFQELPNGVSAIPAACYRRGCTQQITIYLSGKVAGPSCQNIPLNNISELWVSYNQDRFSANCQAFYNRPPQRATGVVNPGSGQRVIIPKSFNEAPIVVPAIGQPTQ